MIKKNGWAKEKAHTGDCIQSNKYNVELTSENDRFLHFEITHDKK